MKFKPLGERALIKPVEREEQTASGIVLPDTAKERPQKAKVVAVGDAEEIKVGIGDVIVFRRYGGTEFSLNGEEYLIVGADDVLGIVEE
jgi:chaperonin GroES